MADGMSRSRDKHSFARMAHPPFLMPERLRPSRDAGGAFPFSGRIGGGMERKSLASDPFQPIGRYCRQIVDELRKTATPAAREWPAWSITSFVFVIPLMILVAGMDLGFGELTLMVFG